MYRLTKVDIYSTSFWGMMLTLSDAVKDHAHSLAHKEGAGVWMGVEEGSVGYRFSLEGAVEEEGLAEETCIG